jgi:hypothetical protein
MSDSMPQGIGYIITAIATALCVYGAGLLKAWFTGSTEQHIARSRSELDRDAQEHTQTVEVYEATVKRLERSNVDLILQIKELQTRQTECERRDAAQGERIRSLEENLAKALAEIADLKAVNRHRSFTEGDNRP